MNPLAFFVLCLQLVTPLHGARPPEIVMDTRDRKVWSALQYPPRRLWPQCLRSVSKRTLLIGIDFQAFES